MRISKIKPFTIIGIPLGTSVLGGTLAFVIVLFISDLMSKVLLLMVLCVGVGLSHKGIINQLRFALTTRIKKGGMRDG